MEMVHDWHHGTIGAKTVEALRKNGFEAVYFPTQAEAVAYLTEKISEQAVVGIGGSMTLQEIGILSILQERGNLLLDHNDPQLSDEEKMDRRRRQSSCDVFLTSTNALTIDGKLVNVDGAGNRVAAMVFGPKQVMVITGINKVVPNLDAAMERIEMYAAPMNSKRLNRATPCVKSGICMDCESPGRICKVTTIIHRKPSMTATTVILIGETLGY